ncbi:putative amino acid transporter [Thelonectria olida]|uniref:Amino acid transporter n=1 Tax=Thelonectria olida TaxID=1576542 RepID=A0A9P9AIY0_9HYPO|nr:putative amino acid transporter [Thelonectria olida]
MLPPLPLHFSILSIFTTFNTLGIIPRVILLIASNYIISIFKYNYPKVYNINNASFKIFGYISYKIFISSSIILGISISFNIVLTYSAYIIVFITIITIFIFIFLSIYTFSYINWIINKPSFTNSILAILALIFFFSSILEFFLIASIITSTYITISIIIYYYYSSYIVLPILGFTSIIIKKVYYKIALSRLGYTISITIITYIITSIIPIFGGLLYSYIYKKVKLVKWYFIVRYTFIIIIRTYKSIISIINLYNIFKEIAI